MEQSLQDVNEYRKYASARFPGGVRLVPRGPVTESLLALARARLQKYITEVGLYDHAGFDGTGADLLVDLPALLALEIRTSHPMDLDFVNCLHELRTVEIDVPRASGQVDFSVLVHLRRAKVVWYPAVSSIADAGQLEEVELGSYKGPDLEKFSAWGGVRDISLIRLKVKSAAGISAWRSARSLMIYEARSLVDWGGLEELGDLQGLRIERVRHLKDLEFLRRMPKLRFLTLDNCGEIESLDPLRDANALEILRVNEGTRILDRRVSWLPTLPALRQVHVDRYRKGPSNDRSPAELSRDVAALGRRRPPRSTGAIQQERYPNWREWVQDETSP